MLETTIKMVSLEYVRDLPVMDLANEYPMLADDQETELIADVEAHGIRMPLILFEETLLDGRNRLSSAIKCELEEIPVRCFVGTIEEAEDLIISLNEKHRHLLPVQRAYIADKHRAIVAERARLRKLATQKNNAAEELRSDMHDPCMSENTLETGTTRAVLARKHNAGQNAIDTVQKIRKVSEETMQDPDSEGEVMTPRAIKASAVLNKMQKGTITISDAVKNVFGEPGQEINPDDPLAKLRSQLNNATNHFKEAGNGLVKGGVPTDVENVRLKAIELFNEFEGIEEVELQTQHYFSPEKEPTDDASRWAAETRIRLAGIDRIITEKDVTPSMVTKNQEFLGVIDRLREFLAAVEDSLNAES